MHIPLLTEANDHNGDVTFVATVLSFVVIYLYYFKADPKKRKFLPIWVRPEIKAELTKFAYYRKLDAKHKSRFEKRVQRFIHEKQFISKAYTHVNLEMKVMIAASAIQLTFGFKHLNFSHFGKILIYKDPYFSRITRKYHMGEVNPNGIIVFSWLNFIEGYSEANDGVNLGLHEMAHALHLENAIDNDEFDFIEKGALKRFYQLAEIEARAIKQHESTFFRSYAAVNMHEFFAVAVENFFERPLGFQGHNPELYHTMTILLKQDPIKLFGLKKPVI